VFFLLVLLGGLTVSAYAAGGVAEGDLGQDVSAIQERLVALGYSLPSVDGDFGPATKQAVVLFQKDRGLPTDGVVGADTYRAILGREMPVSRDGGSTATVRRIIQTAMRYMGVPYVFGGNTPSGFDCSGFVKFVYARCGMDLPRMADEQFEVGVPVPANLLQAGDMVFFSTYDDGASHAGIYVGDGKFISATSSRGVAVDTLDDGYWGPRYIGARRLQ
jgi:hypothetical protein